MATLKVSTTLKRCVYRAAKFRLGVKCLGREIKKECSLHISTQLLWFCNSIQSAMVKKGNKVPITTSDRKLTETFLMGIVKWRIICFPKDYKVFSQEIARMFTDYAKLPLKKQTMLARCKFFIIDGQVFIQAMEDEPPPKQMIRRERAKVVFTKHIISMPKTDPETEGHEPSTSKVIKLF